MYRPDDGGKVVIGQNHIRRLFGHIRTGAAHGCPDVRLFQGGSVVHPVPGHGDNLPVGFQGLQDLDLMGGCDPGKDNNLSYSRRQFLFTQLVHLFAGYYLIFFMSVGKQSQIGRNRPGGIPVVAGDHLNFNPRLPAKLDGGTGFRPRRVDHPQKAEENQVIFHIRHSAGLPLLKRPEGQS